MDNSTRDLKRTWALNRAKELSSDQTPASAPLTDENRLGLEYLCLNDDLEYKKSQLQRTENKLQEANNLLSEIKNTLTNLLVKLK